MITVKLSAAVDAAGTLKQFYFADRGYCTTPVDTPPNTAFIDKLSEAGKLGINAYSDGRTSGASKLETGEIVIANNDGEYDSWLGYSFEGRELLVFNGPADGSYPASHTVLFQGTVDSMQADFDRIVVRIKDKQAMFSSPLLTTTYLGNNVAPNGVEGTASDLKGKEKPLLLGKVFNVKPYLVNGSKLTYQVSFAAVNSVDAVYDNGVPLTPSTDYPTIAALEAATPAASTFITCKALGLLRLGSSATGDITVDATQGATTASRTVAQLLKQIALQAGVEESDINVADVAKLDALAQAEVGVWLSGNSSATAALDAVAASVGAWYGFDGAGKFRMGQLTVPAGNPVATVNAWDVIKQGAQRRVPKDNGNPVWKVSVGYKKLYTVQSGNLAGAVSSERRAELADEYRKAEVSDKTITTQWLMSQPYEVSTLLTNETDAKAEAQRLFDMYSVRREFYDVPIDINSYVNYNIQLMDLIRVVYPRFGMDNGKLFRLLGVRFEVNKNRVTLVLWG